MQQSLQATEKLTPILKEKGLDSIGCDRIHQTQRLRTYTSLSLKTPRGKAIVQVANALAGYRALRKKQGRRI
ncbi:hypothetical protein WKK05_34160 [Nostoc sp. UHCC 0302]|uniref:hypothetical protein n=1 Tax=Nostoc sp. UHCC 0302 TaxID=3134896 RepID=UPI00311C9BBF